MILIFHLIDITGVLTMGACEGRRCWNKLVHGEWAKVCYTNSGHGIKA